VDCYFTSLDYLIKALKADTEDLVDHKTRKSVRARLQTLLESLSTPEEIAAEQAQRYQEVAKALQVAPVNQIERCSCVLTTITDYAILLFNLLASSLLALIVYCVDLAASASSDSSREKVD